MQIVLDLRLNVHYNKILSTNQKGLKMRKMKYKVYKAFYIPIKEYVDGEQVHQVKLVHVGYANSMQAAKRHTLAPILEEIV